MTPRSTCPNDVCIITDAVDGCRGGRRLTTARAVQPGEVILCEAPAISWPHDGVSELVSGFLSADGAVQMSILSLADPSLDADLDLIPDPAWRHEATTTRLQHACERTELARSIAEGFQGGRVLELVEKLLRIAEANCHAFESRVGLFPLASIANHSCEPNCGHTTHGGALRYYANRAIAEGEQITISYLCDLLATSTRERRTTLLLQKCFFCCCARCVRPDSVRGLRCLEAECGGVAWQLDPEAGEAREEAYGAWQCRRCDAQHRDGLAPPAPTPPEASCHGSAAARWRAARRRHAERLALESTLLSAPDPRDAVELKAAVSVVRDQLSPTHYLAARLLAAPAAGCTGALQRLATLECAAAGCCDEHCPRVDGVTSHLPCPELVGEAVAACMWCRHADQTRSTEAARLDHERAAAIGARYVGWAKLHFGAEHACVRNMALLG